MVESLVSFAIASFALAILPGPDIVFLLSQSLAHGTKSGIATAAGLVSGCIVHTTFIAFGLSAILVASPYAFTAIKILGAAYLLYLAYKAYQGNSQLALRQGVPRKNYFQLYKTGIIMNVINPKVMIFFLAFFPGFLWDKTDDPIFQFFILGLIFMGVTFMVFGSIALAAGWISKFLLQKENFGVVMKWVQIVIFAGIAILILFF